MAKATLRANLSANLAGSVWSAALSLLLIPVYIHFLGVEAYGLVGFYAVLQSVLVMFDVGMSATLNREVARLSALDASDPKIATLVRTFEIVFWGIAIVIAGAVVAFAPLIGSRWIHPDRMSTDAVIAGIRLMGLVTAVQFPIALYSGGLLGTERHVLLNTINASSSTLKGVGAIAVLAWISPSIEAFFLWQAIAVAAQTLALSTALHRELPSASGRVDFRLLGDLRGLALGMSGITISGTLIGQLDKILLSHMVSLDEFGVYVVASTAAAGVLLIVGPFFLSVFPRLSSLLAVGDESEVTLTYHRTAQFLSALLLPCVFVLALFSRDVLNVWTGNVRIVQGGWLILTILAVGYGLSGIYNVPNALQLASGWTSLALWMNAWTIVVLVPLAIVGAIRYGAVGVASFWLLVNLGYVLFGVHRMHRRLLQEEERRWWLDDIAAPGIAALVVTGLFRLVLPIASASRIKQGLEVVFVLLVSMVATFVTARHTRAFLGEIAGEVERRWKSR